jgi:hypothetical protein
MPISTIGSAGINQAGDTTFCTTSGNVGIGTASPSYKLDVQSSTATTVNARIKNSNATAKSGIQFDNYVSTGSGSVYYDNTNALFALGGDTGVPTVFNSGGSERMRIDSSGNVGIGTASPAFPLEVRTSGSNGVEASVASFLAGSTAGLSVYVTPSSSGSGSVARFYADSGGNFDTSSILAFDTRNSGTRGERMRITSSGNLLLNTTSSLFNGKFFVAVPCNTFNPIALQNTVTQGAGQSFMFMANSAGNKAGSIDHTGTTTVAYTTSSDYRMKENIAPMTGALTSVLQLKPCTYTWKEDGKAGQGFIAHELQEVVPDCVSGAKDAVDADGNPKYQGIDTSFLVATLTAAIQELKAIVDAQAVEIAALKGTA